MQSISTEAAQQIAVEYLKKKKNADKVDVSIVEKKADAWVVRGTCPIDLEGHPWVEKFAVIIDVKGKVKSIDYSLL